MSPTKSVEQSFVNYWTKMQVWAGDNKIPKSALIPVYNMDLKRLSRGSPMSESERYRAVLASAGLNYSTALPTDTTSPSNVITNVRHTLWSIFTGMNPAGLITNLYDTVKNTIEHPDRTIKALTTSAARENLIQHPTQSIMELVPGALDISKVLEGGKGISTLASHPISALLDAFSFGAIGGGLARLGGMNVADIAAARLGVSSEELATDSTWRNLAKIAKSAQNPLSKKQFSIGIDPTTGADILARDTIGDTLHKWQNRHGIGHTASNLMYGALTTSEKYTKVSQELLDPVNKLMLHLTDAKRRQVLTLLEKSGRSYEDLITDDFIPEDIRSVIQAYEPLENWLQQGALSSGKLTPIRMPTGKTELYTSRTGATIQRQVDNVDKAQQEFYKRSEEANKVSDKAGVIDQSIATSITNVSRLQQSIWQYINQTIPSTGEGIVGKLRRSMTPEHRWDIGTETRFNKDRIYRLVSTEDHSFDNPDLRRLHGISPDEKMYVRSQRELTKSHGNVIEAVFKPGGLIDEMRGALNDKDFRKFRDLAFKTTRWLNRKYALEINVKSSPQLFDAVRSEIRGLYESGKERSKLEDQFKDIYEGKTAKGKKASVLKLTADVKKAMDQYEKAVEKNPPDAYTPIYLDLLTKHILEHEDTQSVLSAAKSALKAKGYTNEQLKGLGDDPRILVELISSFSNATFDDPLIGEVFPGIIAQVTNSAKEELSTLRAQGFTPHYVPHITPHELRAGEDYGTYNIFIKTERIPSISQAFDRTWRYGSTVHNFMAGVTHAVKDQLTRDGTIDFHQNYVLPLTHQYSTIESLIHTLPKYRSMLANVATEEERGAVVTRILKDMNLTMWNPDELFAFKLPRPTDKEGQLVIDSDIANTLHKIVTKSQFPMETTYDKVTNLFRMSILGLSPRFTAHILFGGTYLLALKINPLTFRLLPEAYRMIKDGTMSDAVMHSITQEGTEQIAYHYMGGRTAGRWILEEQLAKLHIDPKVAQIATWIKAASQINYRFTRFVGNMQRALAFFDGASKVDTLQFITDENGKRILNESSPRATYEAMKSVDRVMGDLRRMSPVEREWITRAMPFYGWTKHIIKYVLSFPIDHPFRAQILANMAEANSKNVASGLPMRIQLLLFLGTPDAQGNVTAFTDRFLDPLRTVPNYASISGFISALNPVLTALPAYVDPQIVYGTNTLYPTVSYNDVFGINQASASGGPLTSAEQFVPQIGALAEALKLSSYYRTIAKNTPAAFKKQVFESLNIPFANIQHINLRQIAAKDEIDRYNQAKQAASNALSTGTFNSLKGYNNLPYPINTVYNVTPAQLEALYNETMKRTGLPPQDVLAYLKSPPLL